MIKLGSSNPKLKDYKNMFLNNKLDNLTITDDLSTIILAYKNNVIIEEFLYCDDVEYKEDTLNIISDIAKKCNNVYITNHINFKKISQKDNSIGIITILRFNLLSIDELKKYSFIFILDRLEIPGNIGTLYRSVEACGDIAVVMCDSVSKYNNPKITQSARGSNLYVPTLVTNYEVIQNFLLENQYDIFLGEPNLGKNYKNYDYQGKIAIVVGNERFGINDDWYSKNHLKVYIPMNGSNNSLNVGVAGSILMFEATSKRK